MSEFRNIPKHIWEFKIFGSKTFDFAMLLLRTFYPEYQKKIKIGRNNIFSKATKIRPGVVAHPCNPSTLRG